MDLRFDLRLPLRVGGVRSQIELSAPYEGSYGMILITSYMNYLLSPPSS